jgi:hypothetical protein
MSGSDVAAIAASPSTQDVRKRWLLLAAALVVGLVAAFAIGSAIKKSSAPAPTASLAQSSAAGAQHANITPLTSAGTLPVLHAPPAKPKPKVKVKATTTTPATGSSSPSTGSVAPSTSSTPPSSSTPPASSTPPSGGGGGATAPSSGGGSSSGGGTTGVSHSGGGGGG